LGERLDGTTVDLAVFRKICKVVNEREVRDGVGAGSSFSEAIEIV
jgi:hypothetical protein